MKIQLIQGQFNINDSINLITKMIDAQIKYQEEKIKKTDITVDIKIREKKIKLLQKELYESRLFLEKQKRNITLKSEINLTK